ncbi:DUF3089 domain-containing protein [Croceicoccus ponticola]|uniref:DUF3089 domain-containing protein n=1 Tax=Croceicoccus ponticola TaxID=2217664 RepID=A0A437H1S4_9SPHN|nr:DUF3089 domain-containing protein [Croceicoccus ponticola]RVQ69575.1 DUF3089 domain-containing protein [Croceicoccus ponticola]
MVRKFLYFVAFCVVLVIAGGIVLTIWSKELTELAFTPKGEFVAQDPLAGNAYEDSAMWISRPGMGASDPAKWRPQMAPGNEMPSKAAVFFIHPTSYLSRDNWNAPLDDVNARSGAEMFVRGLASPFNRSIDIWAPRYRQAAVGAFLTKGENKARAIDLAYADVAKAFDYFAASIGKDQPIVLAAHSQGALHLKRLLAEKVAGTPLADKVIAAYVAGWPISMERDLPAMGLPACATANQAGCVMSWQSYAEPADASLLFAAYDEGVTLDGKPLAKTDTLCTNPITGTIDGEAPASANTGTLVPNGDITNGKIVVGAVPARCSEDHLLLVGNPPIMGNAVLPGNNYHVYDIPLFWMNIRQDFARRENAWLESHGLPSGQAVPAPAAPSPIPSASPVPSESPVPSASPIMTRASASPAMAATPAPSPAASAR